MNALQAAPGRCEEASTLSREAYIPCNAPAVLIIGWKGRTDAPIRMCAACADHNVKNRGGEVRGKFEGAVAPLPAQLDIVEQIDATRTAETLIAETLALKDKLAAASKQFDEFCKPFKEKIAANENALLALLNSQRLDSVRADSGTAYKSTITSYKIADRDKVLDLILDNWEQFGSEMLMFNVQKDAVKNYQQENGKLPEGLTSDSFIRLNIRRS